MKRYLFLGGDLRMLYAAKYLNKNQDCCVYGFEGAEAVPVPEAKEPIPCDAAVLPLPASVDGRHICAPYHQGEIDFSVLDAVERGGTVFTSKSFPYLEEICAGNGLRLRNYFAREELQIMNAVPTAEGALEIMLRELPVTVFGLEVLITGYGRIGEAMARMLTALGARVTACARKPEQLAKARGQLCRTVSFWGGELERALPRFDVVINTVPAEIFDRNRLLLLKKECLIIDLASKAGVEDMELAASVGVKVIWALSLPGKTAPVTAGEIIGKTIENILREEEVNG